MRNKLLVVAGVIAIAAIVYFSVVRTKQVAGDFKWKVSPDYSENTDEVAGPREQKSKPGGLGKYPDTGKDYKDGTSTGIVLFGPPRSGKAKLGHKDSKATTIFNCGDGDRCKITMTVSAGGGYAEEQLRVKANILKDNGDTLRGYYDAFVHPGNKGGTTYTLNLEKCGKVKLTATFEEKITEKNKPGITALFTIVPANPKCETDQ